jgi:addiction module RelE/StbE family toxin
MRALVWTNTFARTLKRTLKKKPAAKESLEAVLNLLQKEPFAATLASHKLKGKLTGRWACTVEFDLRIVFRFTPSESGGEARCPLARSRDPRRGLLVLRSWPSKSVRSRGSRPMPRCSSTTGASHRVAAAAG